MITQQTVFILGAGASKPYGYPTGYELRRLIIEDFPKKAANDDFFRHGLFFDDEDMIKRGKEEITYKAKKLSETFERSRTPSIDLFLSRRREFDEIGRTAIAQIIFEKEKESKFEYKMDDISQDWYSYLYRKMTETLTGPDSYKNFSNNKVSFITFNYDRSLEHFLYDALINSFDIPSPTIRVKDLFPFKFIHVYGKLENLDWEDKSGVKYDSYFIPKMVENIKIIYDNESNKSLIKDLREEIDKARRIFFLGFGFAKENMQILGIPEILENQPEIYATARGWTNKEISQIKLYLRSSFRPVGVNPENPHVKDFNCSKLLREYL